MEKLKCWEQSGIPLQQGSGDNAVACTWLTILSNMGPHGQWEIPRVSSEKLGMDVIPSPDHMKMIDLHIKYPKVGGPKNE